VNNSLYLTRSQVLAAQLAVELSKEDGEEPDEALKAIASEQVLARQPSAPTQRASVDEKALSEVNARLQRIEQQLQVRNPEVSGPDQSRPSTQQESLTRYEQSMEGRDIHDPTLATDDPDDLEEDSWLRERRRVNPPQAADPPEQTRQGGADPRTMWLESELGGKPQVGASAQEPAVSQAETAMPDEEVEEFMSLEQWQQLQKRQRERLEPKTEKRDPDIDGPWSVGPM
jgi:hypothetical protein